MGSPVTVFGADDSVDDGCNGSWRPADVQWAVTKKQTFSNPTAATDDKVKTEYTALVQSQS